MSCCPLLPQKMRASAKRGGTKPPVAAFLFQPGREKRPGKKREKTMNRIIWAVGAIVIILAILSFAGFR